MPATAFTVNTTLSPAEVIAFITDFGPTRADKWPNIDGSMYEVHEQGDDWAVVTEGNKMGWERERYSWDEAAGTISIETLDSNLWAAGSGWKYQLTPTANGTAVHVTLTRQARSLKGRLFGLLIPVVGAKALSKQFESAFRRAEAG